MAPPWADTPGGKIEDRRGLAAEKGFKYNTVLLVYKCTLKACFHQLEVAKYPTSSTYHPANLRHQPEVAISGIFGRDNNPKISWASLQNI